MYIGKNVISTGVFSKTTSKDVFTMTVDNRVLLLYFYSRILWITSKKIYYNQKIKFVRVL
jgi:hypothetical protein